ncbi:MAG: hypothetical protein U1F27_17035 [Turneriella sp.]
MDHGRSRLPQQIVFTTTSSAFKKFVFLFPVDVENFSRALVKRQHRHAIGAMVGFQKYKRLFFDLVFVVFCLNFFQQRFGFVAICARAASALMSVS